MTNSEELGKINQEILESKKTAVKRIYWEDKMFHVDERMIFELEDGRKMELAVYGGGTDIDGRDVISAVQFQEI